VASSNFLLVKINFKLCQYEEIVFARTTPEQKLQIVKEFQKRSNIVGMTVSAFLLFRLIAGRRCERRT